MRSSAGHSLAPSGQLGIGVIGAGKVGPMLGAAFRAAGHRVVGITARSPQSRERAELLLPRVPLLPASDLIERSELVVLAVPDDVLAGLVEFHATAGAWQAGQVVVHTSGSHGLGVLAPVRAAGAIPLAIHPATSFTGMSVDLKRLAECRCGISADPVMLPIAQALVLDIGAEPIVIADHQRPRYHAALSHAANHLTTLVAQATQLLYQAGVSEPSEVLGPLLRPALDGALVAGQDALTGPVVRADVGTVAAHQRALSSESEDIRVAYTALVQATAMRARASEKISTIQEGAIKKASGRVV